VALLLVVLNFVMKRRNMRPFYKKDMLLMQHNFQIVVRLL
jgi:hypothetical protein